jgi:hypothetical protein
MVGIDGARCAGIVFISAARGTVKHFAPLDISNDRRAELAIS